MDNTIQPIQFFQYPTSTADAVDLTPNVPLFAMKDTVMTNASVGLSEYRGGLLSNASTTQAGSGNSVFMIDPQQGIWLGAALFANAPFSVDMQGNVIALAGTFNGTFNIGGTIITINDITQLQTAINTVSADGGGTVNLAPGTYNATTSFTIPSNVTLDGNGATIDFGGGAYQILIQGTNAYSTGTLAATYGSKNIVGTGTTWTAAMIGQSILIGDYWYTIATRTDNTHIAITNNFIGTNLAGDTYVIATTVDAVQLKSIVLQNSSTTLLKFRYVNGFNIDGVSVTTGSQGIDGDDSANVNLVGGSLIDNCTSGLTYDNVPFTVINSVLVSNITGGTGIALTRVSNTAMGSLSIQGVTGVGLKFTNCSDLGLNAYAIIKCSSHGIEFISGNSELDILDGEVNTCGGDGIKLTASSDRIILTSNSLINNTGWGVNIAASSCDNSIVNGNVFLNNTSGNLTDSGTSTIAKANQGVTDIPSSTVNESSGVSNRGMATASGTQTIAHGLNHTPTWVKIHAWVELSSLIRVESEGVWISGSYSTQVMVAHTSALAYTDFSGVTNSIIRLEPRTTDSSDRQEATLTADATNITLTWTKTANPGGTAFFLWEAH